MKKKSVITFVFLALLLFSFQNCEEFSSTKSDQDQKSSYRQLGGDGEGFEGKPEPGDYDHNVIYNACGNSYNQRISIDKNESVTLNAFDLMTCNLSSQRLDSSSLEFYFYRPNYISLNGRIFQNKVAKETHYLPEMWCQSQKGDKFVDVMIHYNTQTKGVSTSTLLDANSPVNWVGRRAEVRMVSGQVVTYKADGLDLEVDLSREVFLGQKKYYGSYFNGEQRQDLVCVSGSGTLPETPFVDSKKYSPDSAQEIFSFVSHSNNKLIQFHSEANGTTGLRVIDLSNGNIIHKMDKVLLPPHFQFLYGSFSKSGSKLSMLGYIKSETFKKLDDSSITFFPVSTVTVDFSKAESHVNQEANLYGTSGSFWTQDAFDESKNIALLNLRDFSESEKSNFIYSYSFEEQKFAKMFSDPMNAFFSPTYVGLNEKWLLTYKEYEHSPYYGVLTFYHEDGRIRTSGESTQLPIEGLGQQAHRTLVQYLTPKGTQQVLTVFDTNQGVLKTKIIKPEDGLNLENIGHSLRCNSQLTFCYIAGKMHNTLEGVFSDIIWYSLEDFSYHIYNVKGQIFLSRNFELDKEGNLWFMTHGEGRFVLNKMDVSKRHFVVWESLFAFNFLKFEENLLMFYSTSESSLWRLPPFDIFYLNSEIKSSSDIYNFNNSDALLFKGYESLYVGKKSNLFFLSKSTQSELSLSLLSVNPRINPVELVRFKDEESAEALRGRVYVPENTNNFIYERYLANSGVKDFFLDSQSKYREYFVVPKPNN